MGWDLSWLNPVLAWHASSHRMKKIGHVCCCMRSPTPTICLNCPPFSLSSHWVCMLLALRQGQDFGGWMPPGGGLPTCLWICAPPTHLSCSYLPLPGKHTHLHTHLPALPRVFSLSLSIPLPPPPPSPILGVGGVGWFVFIFACAFLLSLLSHTFPFCLNVCLPTTTSTTPHPHPTPRGTFLPEGICHTLGGMMEMVCMGAPVLLLLCFAWAGWAWLALPGDSG